MNLKEEYNSLVETVKMSVKKSGGKITNEEIAARLSISRTYLSGLLGGSKEVTKKHIDDFKSHFRDEIKGVYIPQIDDNLNPERALMLALLQDYAEWKAEVTGVSFEDVKKGVQKKANLILDDLYSWLPEKK